MDENCNLKKTLPRIIKQNKQYLQNMAVTLNSAFF